MIKEAVQKILNRKKDTLEFRNKIINEVAKMANIDKEDIEQLAENKNIYPDCKVILLKNSRELTEELTAKMWCKIGKNYEVVIDEAPLNIFSNLWNPVAFSKFPVESVCEKITILRGSSVPGVMKYSEDRTVREYVEYPVTKDKEINIFVKMTDHLDSMRSYRYSYQTIYVYLP
ncbi:MAG: hypothetical protein RR751_06700 [Clostridia bacterium]